MSPADHYSERGIHGPVGPAWTVQGPFSYVYDSPHKYRQKPRDKK